MADDQPAPCQVHLLGACHSAGQELALALTQILTVPRQTSPTAPRYSVTNLSPVWLSKEKPSQPPDAAAPACWLLMGLDLDCPAPLREHQQREDAWLRQQLAAAGLVFRVIYGSTAQQRLAQAMQAIDALAPSAITANYRLPASSQRLRAWCEQCSDPDCERKLFTPLSR